MADMDDLQDLKATIEAILVQDVEEPNMPVHEFIDEAERTAGLVADYKTELATVGITDEMEVNINKGAGALRAAEGLWEEAFFDTTEAQKQWRERSPQLYELRSDVIAGLAYGGRDDSGLQRTLRNIRKGNANSDAIQDLLTLAVVVTNNPEAIAKAGMDISVADKLSIMADELGRIYALSRNDNKGYREAKLLRDRAYTYLQKIVREVRDAGQFYFRKQPEIAAQFASAYHRRTRQSTSSSNETTPAL